MIQDISDASTAGTPGLGANAPLTSNYYGISSAGLDLNPDFGTGQNARKAQLPGQGEDWMFRIQVSVAFAVSIGTPVAQIHAVLSNNAIDVALGDPIVIGTLAPSVHLVSTRISQGFNAAQLALGNVFFLRCNPWTAPMGRNFAGATVIGKDHRYVGIVVVAPLSDINASHAFSNGQITATLVKSSDVIEAPSDFIYPAGTNVLVT